MKLNERGSSCGTLMPQSGHASFSEKRKFLAAHDRNRDQPRRQLQRSGDGLFEPRRDSLLDQQTVNDHFDGVILALVEHAEDHRAETARH